MAVTSRYPLAGHGRRPDETTEGIYAAVTAAVDDRAGSVVLPPEMSLSRTAYRMRVRRVAELCGSHASSVSFMDDGSALVELVTE